MDLPEEDRIVAMLRAPLPASAMVALVKGLEATYGRGLRLVQHDENWFAFLLPTEEQLAQDGPEPVAGAELVYRGVCGNCHTEVLMRTDADEDELFTPLRIAELWCLCGDKVIVRQGAGE
jgi:hypothetical protein